HAPAGRFYGRGLDYGAADRAGGRRAGGRGGARASYAGPVGNPKLGLCSEVRVSIFTDPIQAHTLTTGLTPEELRSMARESEIPNSWGIAVYQTRIRSRSARHTYVVHEPTAEHEARLRRVRDY